MVSGFLTSPKDHERIRSGDANAILIASKSSAGRCWLNRLSKSFIRNSPVSKTFVLEGFQAAAAGVRLPRSFLGCRCNQCRGRSLGLFEFHVDRSEEHTSELQSLMRISYAVF